MFLCLPSVSLEYDKNTYLVSLTPFPDTRAPKNPWNFLRQGYLLLFVEAPFKPHSVYANEMIMVEPCGMRPGHQKPST